MISLSLSIINSNRKIIFGFKSLAFWLFQSITCALLSSGSIWFFNEALQCYCLSILLTTNKFSWNVCYELVLLHATPPNHTQVELWCLFACVHSTQHITSRLIERLFVSGCVHFLSVSVFLCLCVSVSVVLPQSMSLPLLCSLILHMVVLECESISTSVLFLTVSFCFHPCWFSVLVHIFLSLLSFLFLQDNISSCFSFGLWFIYLLSSSFLS